MKATAFLVVFGILASTVHALEYLCAKNAASTEMTVTIRQEKAAATEQLESIDSSTGVTGGCKSTDTSVTTTSGTKTVMELVIIVSIPGRTQISPTIATKNCYVKQDAATTTKVKIDVVFQAVGGLSQLSDTVSTVSCDSATAGSSALTFSNGQALSVAFSPTVVAAKTDSVAIELTDATGTALSGAQNLGTLVKIKITYTFATAATPVVPVGIFTYSVIAAGTADFNGPTAELITSQGCKSTSAMAAPFALADSMTYDSTASTATTNVYVSGTFKLAMFDGPSPKNLFIKVQYVAACLTTTEKKCANQQQYCTEQGFAVRRRRSANDVFAPNGTVTIVLPLNVGNGAVAAGYGIGASIAQPECRVPELYWIISVVLGVMLLIVMALCVFLALRLRKERGSVDKFYAKHGQKNPVYN